VGVRSPDWQYSFEDADYGLTPQAKYQTTTAVAKFATFNYFLTFIEATIANFCLILRYYILKTLQNSSQIHWLAIYYITLKLSPTSITTMDELLMDYLQDIVIDYANGRATQSFERTTNEDLTKGLFDSINRRISSPIPRQLIPNGYGSAIEIGETSNSPYKIRLVVEMRPVSLLANKGGDSTQVQFRIHEEMPCPTEVNSQHKITLAFYLPEKK
jgi:hypothetical protein